MVHRENIDTSWSNAINYTVIRMQEFSNVVASQFGDGLAEFRKRSCPLHGFADATHKGNGGQRCVAGNESPDPEIFAGLPGPINLYGHLPAQFRHELVVIDYVASIRLQLPNSILA